MTSRLFELRIAVDACDREIAEALARRSRAVAEIRDLKLETGEARRDPPRESNIIRNAIAMQRAAHGRYDEQTIRSVYAEIFAGCERLTEASVPRPVDVGRPGTTGY